MQIHTNTGGLAHTNGYLLLDESTKTAAIIDAPQDTVQPFLDHIRKEGYSLPYLILTHGHWDHLSDHKLVTDAFPQTKILIHQADEQKLTNPGSSLYPLPYTIPPGKPDAYLTDNQKITVGSLELTILHTPGHCAGMCCLHLPSHHILFAGDLIMAGSVGRYDLEDGNIETLKSSLHRIMQLPDETKILSGHGPASTIAAERNGNPFLHQWGLHLKS